MADKFKPDRATVRAVLDLFLVDGSGFHHNEPNDYGSIDLVLFTGRGDASQYRGEEKRGRFARRVAGVDTIEERGTGSYRLNDKLVTALMRRLAK